MPLDAGVFDKLKTFQDYQRADQDFQLRKQLAAAQIAKAGEIDADKLGEQAFLKAAQGLPLTPQEHAAAQFIDAKSGGMQFNPVTGEVVQRPRISEKIGLDGVSPAAGTGVQQPAMPAALPAPTANMTPMSSPAEPQNEFDVRYQQQLRDAAANPKLQQVIKENYAKSKLSMNESEGKSATYADRMMLAEPILSDPSKATAYSDYWERTKAALTPFSSTFGNYLNSNDYNSFEQAQRNFETAKLRQESGATIQPSEFSVDEKMLLPRASDPPELLAQKKAAREAVLNGMVRQAGPAYKPQAAPATDLYKKGEQEFNARKAAGAIPQGAIEHLLKERNDPQSAAEFDQTFGQGAAARILNGK